MAASIPQLHASCLLQPGWLECLLACLLGVDDDTAFPELFSAGCRQGQHVGGCLMCLTAQLLLPSVHVLSQHCVF